MKRGFLFGVILVLCWFGVGNAEKGSYVQYQQILDNKCSQCHTRLRIEEAIQQGVDMDAVVAKMIRLGARLDDQEREVMGIFWAQGSENKASRPEAPEITVDPLAEYRAVLKSRCTGCHSLEPVEAAMAQGRSLNDLVEMMRKRGAIVTESDFNALAPFWGSPYKEK